ncbi:MAG: AMP-binding protein, partial [Candidatus Promineifilaceae bacterium]
MLTLENRESYHNLLQAASLKAEDGDKTAIIYIQTGRSPIRVSRLEFNQKAALRAKQLRSLGIGPGDLVVIAHTQNLESIYSFWAAMLAGAIPSMFPTLTEKLDPETYMSGMAELVRLSKVKAVLTTDEFAPVLETIVPCAVYSEAILESTKTDVGIIGGDSAPDSDDIAFLQHSSGTTGLQKGVALSHRSVLNQIASYSRAISLIPEDVVVSWLPLYHDMGLIAGFVLPLFQGIPLVLMSPFDWVQHPAILLRAIDEYAGTLCWLPNFAYNHCARRIRIRDTQGISLASMRMFINCSEPVYEESHSLFLDRFRENGLKESHLAVSYAMAENTFAVTQTPPGRTPILDIINKTVLEESQIAVPVELEHPLSEIRVSCGPPIVGTEVRAVDSHGVALAERFVGELAVRSSCMLSEYYR